MTTKPLTGLAAITLTDLRPSPANPRERLTDIDELAASIQEAGLIQPLVVQRIPGYDGYQVVAGHRRLAAVKKLRWETVACIVRRDMLPDEELLTMLIENGQRAGLDPIEEARALTRLKSQGVSVPDIARRIGRSQPYVYARLQLLALDVEEQEQLRAGVTTLGSAVDQARLASGHTRKRGKPAERAWHFAHSHGLSALAKARCTRLGHKLGRRLSGGIACGECWESVIRADERQHLNDISEQRGRCVLCDTQHDADRLAVVG